jgi:predicted DNA-binding protein
MNKEFEKLIIHLSAEMAERLNNASEKLKLSRGSIIREALDEYLTQKGVEKKKK